MSLQHFRRATPSVRWPPAALALAARGEAQEGERLGGVASRLAGGNHGWLVVLSLPGSEKYGQLG